MSTSLAHSLVLHPDDDVAVALRSAKPGDLLGVADLRARQPVLGGHKFARHAISAGAPVRKFGQVIGFATTDIIAGDHVHVHNLAMTGAVGQHHFGELFVPNRPNKAAAEFEGIVRADGTVGTRNYLGVISSVNCSATVSRVIADTLNREIDAFPNIDGVVAITHSSGCGMANNGEGWAYLRRVLTGYAGHANFAGVLLIGLGCEVNQIAALRDAVRPREEGLLASLTIQDAGGTREAIAAGLVALRAMLPAANDVVRRQVSAKHLIIGLQCGGSDGFSGITANPVLGIAVDHLIHSGGSAILSETPEIYGAEHLLTARAATADIADRLMRHVDWWKNYVARHGGDLNNNPSPGNKAGGITTILEKSLGAVAKAGTTGLMDSYGYAEPVTTPGLVFMDSPGYDPVSATGQVAAGANMICFTTGRGSTFGCKPVPSLKIASNTPLFDRMRLDMDFDAGTVLGDDTLEDAGRRLFQLILDTASGRPTCSEHNGLGENEFVPWQIGAVM